MLTFQRHRVRSGADSESMPAAVHHIAASSCDIPHRKPHTCWHDWTSYSHWCQLLKAVPRLGSSCIR